MLAFRFCVVVSAGAIAILGYRANASAVEMPEALETQSEQIAVLPATTAPQPPTPSEPSAMEMASEPMVSPEIEPPASSTSAAAEPLGSEAILDAFKAAFSQAQPPEIAEGSAALAGPSEAVFVVETTPDRAPEVLEVFKNTIARFEGVEHAIVTESPNEPDSPVTTSVSPSFTSTQGIPFDRILERFKAAAQSSERSSLLPSEQAIPIPQHLLNPGLLRVEATQFAPKPAESSPSSTAAVVPPASRTGKAIAAQTVIEAFAAILREAPPRPSPELAPRLPLSPPETQANAEFSPPQKVGATVTENTGISEQTLSQLAPAGLNATLDRLFEGFQQIDLPAPEAAESAVLAQTAPLNSTSILSAFSHAAAEATLPRGDSAEGIASNDSKAPDESPSVRPALNPEAFEPFSNILNRFKAYRPEWTEADDRSPVATVEPERSPQSNLSQRDVEPVPSDDFAAPSPRSVLNAFQQVLLNPPQPADEMAIWSEESNPRAETAPGAIAQVPLFPSSAPAEPLAPQPAAALSAVDAPVGLDSSPNPLLFPTRPEEVQIDINRPITLEEALELARRNNPQLQAAQLELEISREQLREAFAAEYPTLSTQFNLVRTDSAQQRLNNGGQNPPLSSSNTISTSADARLELSYDLLTGGRRTAQIKAAEEQIRLRQLSAETLSEQTRFEVTRTYYDLQEADARTGIEVAAVEDATRTLRDAELLEQAGLGTRFDVLRAQVDLANSQQNLATARARQVISRRELATVLGINQQANVSAADPIERVGAWDLSLAETIVLAFRNRAELEQQLVQRNISEQQREIALSALRPQVSLFANYNILGLLDDDRGLADGYSVGARMQWTLFEGGAARSRAAQQEKNSELAASRFDNQRNQVRLEVEQAYNNLQASETNIQTANIALQLAQESLRLARLRFSAGVGTQTEVITAQTELTRARGNLLTAIVNYNRSSAALQRAVSNLPDSRLFDLP